MRTLAARRESVTIMPTATDIVLANISNTTAVTPADATDDLGHLFLITSLSVIFLLSCLLNGFTLFVFVQNKILHTTNNYFIVNLAVTDWLYIATVCSTSILAHLSPGHELAVTTCRFLGYVAHSFYSLSINTCAIIGFHRYISIVFPQKRLLVRPSALKVTIILLWIYSLLICLPGVLGETSYHYNEGVSSCTILSSTRLTNLHFSLYVLAVNFLVPYSLMIFFYSQIYRTVQMHKVSVANSIQGGSDSIECKARCLMCAVLALFLVTWIPYYLALFASNVAAKPLDLTMLQIIWTLKLLNSIIHPVLYALCNRLFLQCMLNHLCCKGGLRSSTILTPFPAMAKAISAFDVGEGHFPTPLWAQKFHPTVPADELSRTLTETLSTRDQNLPITEHEDPAKYRRGNRCKGSTCSACTGVSASFSTCSSVPTLFRFDLDCPHRRSSSNCTMHSLQPKCSSCNLENCPCPSSSQKPKVSATFRWSPQYEINSPTDETPPPAKHGWSRNSFHSSGSGMRSGRSSMSSRLSQFGLQSARSSCSSYHTNMSTPFSTRPNSPSRLSTVPDCESDWQMEGMDRYSSCSHFSRHSSRSSIWRPSTLQNDLVEEDEPSASSVHAIHSNASSPGNGKRSRPDAADPRETLSRLSKFMLGDINPEDAMMELMEDQYQSSSSPLPSTTRCSPQPSPVHVHVPTREPVAAFPPHLRKAVMTSTARDLHTPENMVTPRERRDFVTSFSIGKTPVAGTTCVHQRAPEQEPARKSSLMSSIAKAVHLVLSAKRFKAQACPSVAPAPMGATLLDLQPDPPNYIPVTENVPVREPSRYVYERAVPDGLYGYGQRPMSHLRVPGRQLQINVPQTILEEELPPDLPSPSVSPSPPPGVPLTPRRRKNASSWITPPVIDVVDSQNAQETDMRVECPGVLIEHHT